MHKKQNQRLKLALSKKTIVLLGEKAEQYKTGNRKDHELGLFTAGYPRCYTVKPTKESLDCTLDCTFTG